MLLVKLDPGTGPLIGETNGPDKVFSNMCEYAMLKERLRLGVYEKPELSMCS